MITNPAVDISNCVVWLDASDTTTLFQLSGGTTAVTANLDPVGYWGDKSGNTRHFTNIGGSATTRPTWISSLSTVRFNGSTNFLYLSAAQAYTEQTTFVVTAPRSFLNLSRIYTQAGDLGTGDNDVYVPLFQNESAGVVSSYWNNSTGAGITQRSLSAFDVITSLHNGTQLRNFLNGQSSATQAHALNYTARRHVLGTRIGTTGIAAAYYNGDISEVIVYNRALTNNERADVEYYLTRKWNFLNSIPRQTYAIKNGLWSDSATWSVSAEPSPWNFPLSADNVYTNTFTVTADSSTRVDTIRNSALVPNISAGGSFVLANGVSLSAIPWTGGVLSILSSASAEVVADFTVPNSSQTAAIRNTTNGALTLRGNVTLTGGTNDCHYINNSSSGTIIVRGNVNAGPSGQLNQSQVDAIRNSGSGSVIVYGNLFGGRGNGVSAGNAALRHSGSGNTFVYGDVYGNPGTDTTAYGYGICIDGTGTISVSGNLYASNASSVAPAVQQRAGGSSSTLINVNGNVFGTNVCSAIICSQTAASNLSAYGNIINAPNGRQAIYAPRYQVFPSSSPTYTRQAVNGYDSYVDYWTSDATFTYPASSDVVLSTVYKNNTLSGSMALPSPSSVFLNCPVGSTTTTIFQITTGNRYLITSNPLDTNFTLMGASSNTPGTIFVATSAISLSTPITAYNSDTGRVVPLGTSTPPTVDSFWNRALTDIPSSTGSVGNKLKKIITTTQLSSIYNGLVYYSDRSF